MGAAWGHADAKHSDLERSQDRGPGVTPLFRRCSSGQRLANAVFVRPPAPASQPRPTSPEPKRMNAAGMGTPGTISGIGGHLRRNTQQA